MNMYLYILHCAVILAAYIYFNWKDGENLTLGILTAMFLVAMIPVFNWIVLAWHIGCEFRNSYLNCNIENIILLKGRGHK